MFQAMDYVYEVYQEKSFSKAAEKLFVSQPALSASIKKTEKKIGLPLFDRSTNPIQLTPAGKAYIDAAKEIFAIKKRLENYYNDLSHLKNGTLVLGGTNFFASCLLPPMIKDFSNKHPGIGLEIHETSSDSLYQKLLTEEIDMIVDSGIYNEALYESIPLLEDHILLAAPRKNPINLQLQLSAFSQQDILLDAHLQNNAPAISLNLFSQENFLLLGKGNDMNRRALKLCQNSHFTPIVTLYLNQLMTSYNMARQGLGVTFVTDSLIKLSPPDDSLLFYKLSEQETTRKIFIAHKKNCYLSHAMQEFISIGTKTWA